MVCGLEIEQLWCCVVGIINYKVEYLAAILGFICADEAGKTAAFLEKEKVLVKWLIRS